MARRGRFGRSETGASNLSAMIRQLAAQQQAAQEQALMNAYYNGIEYNGSIPTMSDVTEFYNGIAEASGAEPGSPEYNAIQQKIVEANNFDVKRTYNELISDFNLSNGSNYNEIISFLNGRANDTTDAGDKQAFAEAFETVTSAYITFTSNRLGNREIGISEYRSMIDSALGQLDPNSQTYRDSVVTARTTEWKYEKNAMDKKMALGRMSASEYKSWAQKFRKTVTATGVPAGDLLDDIDLAILDMNRRISAAVAASNRKKAGVAESGLLNLFAIAASSGVVAVKPTAIDKLSNGEPFTIDDILENPEVIAGYMRLVDAGAIPIDRRLQESGILEGYQLRAYYDQELRTYVGATEKAYAITGKKSDAEALSSAKSLYFRTGSASGFDELSDASSQYARDLSDAGTSDFKIFEAVSEWSKYLAGIPSKYGVIPPMDSLVPPEYSQEQTLIQSYILNSIFVANGGVPQEGQLTLEGALNFSVANAGGESTPIQQLWENGSVEANRRNVVALMSGDAAVQVSVVNGQQVEETIAIPAINQSGVVGTTGAQAAVGRLNQVAFAVVQVPRIDQSGNVVLDQNGQPIIDSRIQPYVQSALSANEIMISSSSNTSGLERWGFKYVINGEDVFVKTDGKTYYENPFKSVLGSIGDGKGTMVPVGDQGIRDDVAPTEAVPGVDLTSLYKIYGDNNVTKLRELGLNIEMELLNDSVNPNVSKMLQVIGANTADVVGAASIAITRRADELELKQLQSYSYRLGEKGGGIDQFSVDSVNARVAELQATLYGGEYQTAYANQYGKFAIVQNNKNKYKYDPSTGDYVLNDYYTKLNAENERNAILRGIAGSLLPGGLLIGNLLGNAFGSEHLPERVSTRLNKPDDSSSSVSYTSPSGFVIGGASGASQERGLPSSSYLFFRNLTAPVTAPSAKPMSVSMPSQLPTAKVTTATVPKTRQQAQSLIAATPFNPNDPEARRALVQLSTTLPSEKSPIKNPGAR